MVTPIFGCALTGLMSTSVTNYWYITSTFSATGVTTEANRQIPFPNTFTVGNLYVQVSTAPGVGTSWDFTVNKNGSATSLTVNISGTDTNATDSTHTVTFNAGDTITLSSTPNSTPGAPGSVYWNLAADSGANAYGVVLGGSQSNPSTTVTNYNQPFGGNTLTWDTTEGNVQGLVATGGSLSNLYLKFVTAPTAGKSYAITLVQNGSPSALTATVSGTGTTASDTTHSVSMSAGDSISTQAVPNGTPTTSMMGWSMQWNPTTNGESIYGYGNSAAPSASATNYDQGLGNGRGTWNATESVRQIIPGAYTMTALYVKIGTAPGVGNSRTFTLRNNSATSALTFTIADNATTGSITGQTVNYSQGNPLDLESKITNTPAAITGGVHSGFVIYNAPATTSKSTLLMLGVG